MTQMIRTYLSRSLFGYQPPPPVYRPLDLVIIQISTRLANRKHLITDSAPVSSQIGDLRLQLFFYLFL